MSILTLPDIDPIRAHSAQSDRLDRLRLFLAHFAPAFGETCGQGLDSSGLVDEVTPPTVKGARNAAILAAFNAIERIADQS